MTVAPLAAMTTGCAYQPLDPTYLPKRLSFMVEDASAAVLVTTPELRPLVDGYDGTVVLLDEPPATVADAATHELVAALPKPTPESRLILLHTSSRAGRSS